jgi:hypothetical protein
VFEIGGCLKYRGGDLADGEFVKHMHAQDGKGVAWMPLESRGGDCQEHAAFDPASLATWLTHPPKLVGPTTSWLEALKRLGFRYHY